MPLKHRLGWLLVAAQSGSYEEVSTCNKLFETDYVKATGSPYANRTGQKTVARNLGPDLPKCGNAV